MAKVKVRYYTKEQLVNLGISPASIENWARNFEGTAFVRPPVPRLYSEDFKKFALERAGKTGPANLPDFSRIATLFSLVRAGHSIDTIASSLNEQRVIIESQLQALGLEAT